MTFKFKIEEPGKPPKIVDVGPHETAYSAKRAIEHVYSKDTKFTEIKEGEEEIPATPAPVIAPPEITPPQNESGNS